MNGTSSFQTRKDTPMLQRTPEWFAVIAALFLATGTAHASDWGDLYDKESHVLPKKFWGTWCNISTEELGCTGGEARGGRGLGARREPQRSQGSPQQCLKRSN